MGWPVEMLNVALEGPRIVRSLRSCREEQRPEGERGTDSLLHWRFIPHVRRPRKFLGLCYSGSAHQPAHCLGGGPHWHNVTQNARRAKVGCACKTTGMLGEIECEFGMSPGTSSFPGSAERQGKHRCLPGVPVREGTGKKQGWWCNFMSQETLGE